MVFSTVGDTALAVLVPEAEPVVAALRSEFDSSAEEHMPAHLTVLYPFIPERDIDEVAIKAVEECCASQPAAALTFAAIGTFPGTIWLDPASADATRLLERMRAAFPDCLPYGRCDIEPIPHLTIGDGVSAEVMERIRREVAPQLPITARLDTVELMAFDGARWALRGSFRLAAHARELGASPYPILGDDLLVLRPLSVADASEHLTLEDDEFIRWFSGGAGTLDGVTAWIERMAAAWATGGHVHNFGIRERASGRLVGNIEANSDLAAIDGLEPGDANVSYGLAREARGHGYATRSVHLLCAWLAGTGLRRAVIRAEPGNLQSHRVAERAGFERAGELTTRDGTTMLRWVRPLALRQQ